MRSCGEVTRDKVRERQFLHAFRNLECLCVVAEKVPLVKVVHLACTFPTPILHRLLGGDCCFKEHNDAFHDDVAGKRSDL